MQEDPPLLLPAGPLPMIASNRLCGRSGFTLVELVIVTLLLGVLAGIAAPRYQSALESTRLETAAKQLAADLRHTRSLALSGAAAYGLTFDPAAGTYGSLDLSGRVVPSPDRDGETLLRATDDDLDGVTIASADFGGAAEVTFDFRGDPSATGQVVLAVGAASRTVAVDTLGGVTVAP